MKKIISSAVLVLAVTLFIAVMPTEAEGKIYEDTVRLHVLANSDSEEDQNLKLIIRDLVLDEYGYSLSVFESADEAKKELSGKLDEIEAFCNGKLKTLTDGKYTAKVTLSEEWYDTREYENFTLPKGYYTSLRIIIGSGEGKNWWCVMFPPLCLDAATSDIEYSEEEKLLITKKYNVKFKIVEVVSEFWK